MILLSFIIFNLVIYFFGRGLIQLLNLLNRKDLEASHPEILGIKISFYYPIFGLIFIGNFLTIQNFFVGINNLFTKMLFLLVLLINFKKIIKIKINLEGILSFFITPLILSISSLNLGIHGDASLYHLNYQNWIRSEKIVLGLSNLSARYGYSSIYDYISSIFWINNNFLYLHFLNLVFFVIFFNFLTINLLAKKKNNLYYSSYFLLIFGLLDNFGINGGRNSFIYIEGIGKQDVAFAVMFLITNILIYNSLKTKEIISVDFKVASLLVLFLFQLRVFGILVVLPLFFWFFKFNKFNIRSLFEIIRKLKLSIFLGIIWIIKNILITGCIVFPISEKLCFDSINWYINGTAHKESEEISWFFHSLSYEGSLVAWYNHWTTSLLNVQLTKNFFISFMIILFFKILFLINKNKKNFLNISFLTIYLFLTFFMWIYSAPGFRFFMGYFMFLIALLGISDFEFRYFKNILKISELKEIKVLLLILCILFIPLVSQYKIFFKNNFFDLPVIYTDIILTNSNPLGWGETPKESYYCNINIRCIPYARDVNLFNSKIGYKIFK